MEKKTMTTTVKAQDQSSANKGLDAGKKAEAKVPASTMGYDKIAELAYDAEMKHEGDTHQIFFDLLDQGTQKNHINLGTGSALKAGRKYNDSIGTVNVTVGDNKDSGKKLSFTDANALDFIRKNMAFLQHLFDAIEQLFPNLILG